MRLSEKNASGKFCPFVRPDYLEASPFKGKPLCIGSACMAWRWSHDTTGLISQDRDGNPLGYCGLAGTPE